MLEELELDQERVFVLMLVLQQKELELPLISEQNFGQASRLVQ
jgi:hypothetical protein